MSDPMALVRSVPSGVPGLDAVLGGGLPEFSLNVIAGGPGTGKTTLALQIAFAAATQERPALYFTVMGEPAIKLLRYQSQFSFFDTERVGSHVKFVNLSEEAMKRDLSALLVRIQREIEQAGPRIIVVDSFRTVLGPNEAGNREMNIDLFVQKLALQLTSWEITSFLIGEYAAEEQRYPVFTVADGVFWVSQETNRNSVVRKLQVLKIRGRAHMPGLHTFRITNDGVQVFPRIPEQQHARRTQSTKRHTTGIPGLDELMGGGIPIGDAVMIAGPAGSGKTTFATQFIAEGIRKNEAVVVAVFEEYPEEYLARARARSHELQGSAEEGELRLIYLRPLDLSVDEMLSEILDAVNAIGAERVVIDSLSGFEIALAPSFREDFRESLYRLIGALTATGVTVLMTAETVDDSGLGWISTEKISFITDDVLIQRSIEIDGELRKVLAVLKMRGSAHSNRLHAYEITENGAAVLPSEIFNPAMLAAGRLAGLTGSEGAVLDALTSMGKASTASLGQHIGMDARQVQRSLDRIVALGYGIAEDSTDGYRWYAALAMPHA